MCAILLLSTTQQLLSSTSLAAMPHGEQPAGCCALMFALIGILRGVRALFVFVIFGWQPLVDAWLWAQDTGSWLGA